MGLVDKVKAAMGSGKHSEEEAVSHVPHSGTGTTAGTGTQTATGRGGSGAQRAEQGVASHMPGSHGSSGTTGTGTGQSGVQRAEQGVASHIPGSGHHGSGHHHSGTTGSGVGSGTGSGRYSDSGNTGTGRYSESGTGAGTGTGTGTGYSGTSTGSGSGTGGTRSYQVGNPAELEGRRGEMSNIVGDTPNLPTSGGTTQNLSADYDRAHWREAMEKTELAEHEVASATMHADRANNALGKAQNAQGVMSEHASEHDRLLAEAERQRGLVQDPSHLRGGINSAQADLDAARDSAAQHNRALKDADSAYAAKQREVDSLAPRLQAQDQKMHSLADQYDNAMAKRDAVATDAERLRTQALEAERARSGLGSTVEQLMEKLRLAEEEMVTRERAFLQARDNHRSLHDQLRRTRGELDGVTAKYEKDSAAANTALESAQGWDDKTGRIRAQLMEHEQEHNRLLELIQRLKAELEAMLADLEGLRRHGQPNRQAIEEAELGVNNKRNALREAEARAKDAESRYRMLVKEADSHKSRASQAANAANKYAGDYQGNLKEAELHGDRHVQLWNEAQTAGTTGSSNATSAFEKLKGKVDAFAHREP